MAHTDLSEVFYLLHTAAGDSAMNKFEPVANGTAKFFQLKFCFVCWKRRNERSSMLATAR
jgi:hypothetical protein